MREIGLFDAKNKFSSLIASVERGEEIVITKRGKVVARLIPETAGFNRAKAMKAAQRIRKRAKALKLGSFNWGEWKSYRDEGRP